MVAILGTPYERGHSDIIVSRAFTADVVEGCAVSEKDVDGVLTMDKVNGAALGVAGRKGIVAGDEIKAGLKVYVVAANDAESITVGAQVYVVKASGKFTQTADEAGNTTVAVNATARTGIVDCVNSNGNAVKGFAIDFPNGL